MKRNKKMATVQIDINEYDALRQEIENLKQEKEELKEEYNNYLLEKEKEIIGLQNKSRVIVRNNKKLVDDICNYIRNLDANPGWFGIIGMLDSSTRYCRTYYDETSQLRDKVHQLESKLRDEQSLSKKYFERLETLPEKLKTKFADNADKEILDVINFDDVKNDVEAKYIEKITEYNQYVKTRSELEGEFAAKHNKLEEEYKALKLNYEERVSKEHSEAMKDISEQAEKLEKEYQDKHDNLEKEYRKRMDSLYPTEQQLEKVLNELGYEIKRTIFGTKLIKK